MDTHTAPPQTAELTSALIRAIAHGELELHYQPVVALDDGRITGFEALVRWQRPGHGTVGPDVFIGVAEETGLSIPLGAWVLEQACREVQAWSRRWGRTLGVSVNVTAKQLADPSFVATVQGALAAAGMPETSLTLEITEQAPLTDLPRVVAALGLLRTAGVRIALDDFGTGHCGLQWLADLPFDVLKIDRSLVTTLTEDPTDGRAAILSDVVSLVRTLGASVCAEGIETEAQRRAVVDLGCQTAQGYLISRPLPVTEIAVLLDAGSAVADLRIV